jgi:hypothetical protein
MKTHSVFSIVMFLAAVMTSGCGTHLTKVSGKVTLDGKPVDGATVVFTETANPSLMSTGVTDAQGEYSLTTFSGGDKPIRGCPPGNYQVSITKKEEDGPPPADTSAMTIEERIHYDMSRSGRGMSEKKKFIYHVPQKYELAQKSGLTVEVPSEGNIVKNFALESDETKK